MRSECLTALKKAVNLKVKNNGDDFFHNRLFSYLQQQLTIPIQEIRPIRKHVYLVKANSLQFILKGFSSYHRLMLQEVFTTSLKQEKFRHTYSFFQLAKKPPLFFEQMYYGCLEYITPKKEAFSYHLQKDRTEGLELLNSFHATTKKLIRKYRMLVPSFKQIEKWEERTELFLKNFSIIQYFVQKEIIYELLFWANWSLEGLQDESHVFDGHKVILHGDVAHHNFLRKENDELFLIDFDLISIGAPHADYLQYANRILPFINWSFQELTNYKEIKPYLTEAGFLYALAYPTDIFREWNRAIKDGTYLQKGKNQQLLEITVGQFKKRKKFFREIQKAVSD